MQHNKYNLCIIHFIERGGDMDINKIVSILIQLLEDQEGAKINYKIVIDDEVKDNTKETA